MKNLQILVLALSGLFVSEKSIADNLPEEDLPTSAALPAGMKLVWSDEFNGTFLDKNKWSTNYYSILDFVNKSNYEKFLAGKLPQPGIQFTGHSMVLVTNDEVPAEAFSAGRKISSIQTYDWKDDRLYLDNRLGGFIEARIKRNSTADAKMVNGAFWLDSPGPDARYFVEKGNNAHGVAGIRPHGQVFEIDLCENLNTEIVLHGNVSPAGKFEHNIGHFPVKGDYVDKWVIHSMLWSPAGLKFYIDGKLIKEYWNPHDIKSPNHAMNILLGMYAKGGTATMEVDYIRYYQWELDEKNELPNPGFEYHSGLFPWEGNGTITPSAARTGNYGLELAAGKSISQYVFLDHSRSYTLKFWAKGSGAVTAKIENITQVSGVAEDSYDSVFKAEENFKQDTIRFSTNPEFGNHKRTVKITFTNSGSEMVSLDDVIVNL